MLVPIRSGHAKATEGWLAAIPYRHHAEVPGGDPAKLSVEALTAFGQLVEVLGERGLFAITGTTGVGKRTLLDALCLALLDTTPWLDCGRGARGVWIVCHPPCRG